MKKRFLSFFFIIVLAFNFSFVNLAYAKNDKNKEPISIAMATDRNYIYPTVVAMTSILENKKSDTKINFYIMISGDFLNVEKNRLLRLQRKYSNCKVRLINMKDNMNSLYTSRHLSRATYYRLMLPSLLPNLDKVLYLDTDIIVKKDLSALFNYNIDNFYLAGVLDVEVSGNGIIQGRASVTKNDIYMNKYGKDILLKSYVNAGILLFNLKKMRRDNLESKLLNCISSYDLEFHDQDALNLECFGKIMNIPNIYNIASWQDFYNDQVIVHFLDVNKPWKWLTTRNSELWWKYAEKTDCFKNIQSKYLVNDGKYVLSSALNDKKALDISGASKGDGANLQLWDKNRSSAQRFNVKYVGGGCMTISPECSNKAIDVCEARKEPGTNVWQYRKNNLDAQKWYIVRTGDGYHKIFSKCNGLCLDVDNASTENGTNIKCWWNNDSNAQKFKIRRIA